MMIAYHPDAWQLFYTTVAGASAALTGLLFVALSVNLRLVRDPAHRAQAREAVSGLLILVILALVVLIPGQGASALGWELAVGGLVLAGYGVRLQAQTVAGLPRQARSRWLLRLVPLEVATLAVPVAGISLLLGQGGGLLWLVPTVLIYLVWAAMNAWALLVQAAGTP